MAATPTEITVAQHGEKRRTPGDPGLTKAGTAQAIRTAELLVCERPDALWCSPFRRSRETARPIAAASRLRARVEPRLVERMNWDGTVPIEDFLAEWDRATEDRSYVPVLGESSSAAGARFVAVLHDAMAGYPGGHVVLVTHGGVTVDGLRSLVGDRALSEACPEWTAACRRAG